MLNYRIHDHSEKMFNGLTYLFPACRSLGVFMLKRPARSSRSHLVMMLFLGSRDMNTGAEIESHQVGENPSAKEVNFP